jgi:hypothetical protein
MDLKSKSLPELKAIAKEFKIKGYSTAMKKDLLKTLETKLQPKVFKSAKKKAVGKENVKLSKEQLKTYTLNQLKTIARSYKIKGFYKYPRKEDLVNYIFYNLNLSNRELPDIMEQDPMQYAPSANEDINNIIDYYNEEELRPENKDLDINELLKMYGGKKNRKITPSMYF